MTMSGRRARRSTAAVLAACALGAGGCRWPSGPFEMDTRLEGDFRGELKGDMQAGLRLEGPIVVQMQGPTLRTSGTFVSEQLYDQVRPDKTTSAWVIAAFGEPDRTHAAPEGGEYWVWAYRLGEVQGSMVEVLAMGGGDEKKTPSNVTTVVRVVSGVVVEKWRG